MCRSTLHHYTLTRKTTNACHEGIFDVLDSSVAADTDADAVD